MAERRRNTGAGDARRYRTDGSAAYQPEFEQEPLRHPSRREQVRGNTVRRPEPQRREQIRPRKRPAARPDIQVRPQGAVSLFAVVGLFAVLACTMMFVVNCARLAVANNDIVELRAQLSNLQDENRTLQTKYELMFDLEAIEKQFLSDGTMVKPGANQTVYLDLSGGDRVVYYDGGSNSLSGMLQRVDRFFADLLS